MKPETTQGRATYLQVGSSSAIVFRRGFWIIDRNGVPWICDGADKKTLWMKDCFMVFCIHFVVFEGVLLFDHKQTPNIDTTDTTIDQPQHRQKSKRYDSAQI